MAGSATHAKAFGSQVVGVGPHLGRQRLEKPICVNDTILLSSNVDVESHVPTSTIPPTALLEMNVTPASTALYGRNYAVL